MSDICKLASSISHTTVIQVALLVISMLSLTLESKVLHHSWLPCDSVCAVEDDTEMQIVAQVALAQALPESQNTACTLQAF